MAQERRRVNLEINNHDLMKCNYDIDLALFKLHGIMIYMI